MPSTYVGLAAIEARIRAGMVAGVNRSVEQLLPKIEADTPVLSGTLKGGEDADPATAGPNVVEARVHTGAAADEYAIVQHQRKKGHKYVRDPLVAHIPDHLETVAEASREALDA